MPDGQKIVAMPTGEKIGFPATMQDSEINNVLTNWIPGSGMAPKGPVAPQTVPAGLASQPSELAYRQGSEGLATKLGRGATMGAFSGAGIPESQHPVMDLLRGLLNPPKPSALDLADPTGGALRGAIGLGKSEAQSLQEATGRTPGADAETVAHGLASAVTRPLTMLGGGEKAGEAVTGVPESIRVGAQKTLGIGPDFVRQGAEKVGEEQAATIGEQQAKIQQAKISEPQRFQEYETKRKAAIDTAKQVEQKAFADADAKYEKQKQTAVQATAESQQGFNQRQQHLDIANQHAQAIADKLPQIHQDARAEASAAYGPQPKGTYDPTEIKNLIQDTASAKLQGTTKLPAAISKIISDIDKPPEPTLLDQASVFRGAGKGMRGQGKEFSGTRQVSADEALSAMDPKARAKYLSGLSEQERAQLQAPTETGGKQQPLDAARIHGFMSELGRAAQSGSLSGDEISAINATRSALEGRLRKLYDAEGRTADFTKGQAAWKQMANTFENASSPAKGGSPIAQALQTKDPVTGKLRPDYVQAALSGDKSFPIAKQMLDRYKHLGAPTNELEVMKTHGDFADTLPSQVKWKAPPSGPEYPTVTKYPQVEPPKFTEFGTLPKTPADFDPIEARKVALKQKGQSLSGTGGPYGIMRDIMGMKGVLTGNPMALSYPVLRRMLGGGVGSEGLVNWLSKATPEELQMAKEIPARKVALKKAQKSP